MKAIFKIFPERKLIVARFTGTIAYQDVLQWFDEAREHPDFSQEFPGLVDLRKAAFGMVPGGKTGKMAKKARALAEYMTKIDFTTAKWAILTDTPMETSLMMVYSKDASQRHPIEIFSTVEAAEDYLGVALEYALQELSAYCFFKRSVSQNHFLHMTGVPLRSTPAGEKHVSGMGDILYILT